MDSVAWVWVVAIVTSGVTAVLVAMFRSGTGKARRLSAEEVLRLRFARGEITEGDYLRQLAILEPDQFRELSE